MPESKRREDYNAQRSMYNNYLNEIAQKVNSDSSMTRILDYYGIPYRNFQLRCPFHDDQTPSMHIYDDKNVRCFVENKTWYATTFVRDYERQNGRDLKGLYDILQRTIEIQGLNIELLSFRDYFQLGNRKVTQQQSEEAKLKQIMRDAVTVSTHSLSRNLPFAERTREYLKSRHLSQKTIDNFKIGVEFNNRIPNALMQYKGYTIDELANVDLVKLQEKQSQYEASKIKRETFINRVLVPICDENGNPVGFGGRVLDDSKPKYLNTSNDSKIFDKSNILFNYHQAKHEARNNEIVLVEGYFDVVSAYEMGMKNVVGLMGLALSERKIQMIKDLNCEVIFCLDNDNAGKNAMIKLIPQLLHEGLIVNVYDTSTLGNLKDFGDFNESGKTVDDIKATKITGFQFLLKHYYFENRKVEAQNIALVYHQLQTDGLINNSLNEDQYIEYVSDNSIFDKEDIESMIHPKEIDNRVETAMRIRFLRAANKSIMTYSIKNNVPALEEFVQQNKLTLTDLFIGLDDDECCSADGQHLNMDKFITKYVMNMESYKEILRAREEKIKEYPEVKERKRIDELKETFKDMLNNVWTYDELKNPVRVWLNEEQKENVIKQFLASFPEGKPQKDFEDYPELYTKLFIAQNTEEYDLIASKISVFVREKWKIDQFIRGKMALVPYNDCFPDSLTQEDMKKISPKYVTKTVVKEGEDKGEEVYYFNSLMVFNNMDEEHQIHLTEENFIEPTREDEKDEINQSQEKENNKRPTHQRGYRAIKLVIPLEKNQYLKTGKGIYIIDPQDKTHAVFLESGHFTFNEKAKNVEFNLNHQNNISLYKLEELGNFQSRTYQARLERSEFFKDYKHMYYAEPSKEIEKEERSA